MTHFFISNIHFIKYAIVSLSLKIGLIILSHLLETVIVYTDDFRLTGPSTFQALSTFCELINETISNRLIQFYSSQYVSASVTPLNVFQLQTQSFISQFISSTTNDFLLSLSTIRNTTQSNALLSGQLTNYELYTADNSIYAIYHIHIWYG